MIRVVACDYDGTLVDSFRGNSAIVRLKVFFFRALKRFFIFGEFVEVLARVRYALHAGAEEFVSSAIAAGLVVGVITDRSLFGFIISSRRAGLPLGLWRFVHARRSVLDRFVQYLVPGTVTVLTTSRFKGEIHALDGFVELCASLGTTSKDVLFVGDDERDRIAAEQYCFRFAHVDRTRPDFEAVRKELERA